MERQYGGHGPKSWFGVVRFIAAMDQAPAPAFNPRLIALQDAPGLGKILIGQILFPDPEIKPTAIAPHHSRLVILGVDL